MMSWKFYGEPKTKLSVLFHVTDNGANAIHLHHMYTLHIHSKMFMHSQIQNFCFLSALRSARTDQQVLQDSSNEMMLHRLNTLNSSNRRRDGSIKLE